jgi:hypothetical protein
MGMGLGPWRTVFPIPKRMNDWYSYIRTCYIYSRTLAPKQDHSVHHSAMRVTTEEKNLVAKFCLMIEKLPIHFALLGGNGNTLNTRRHRYWKPKGHRSPRSKTNAQSRLPIFFFQPSYILITDFLERCPSVRYSIARIFLIFYTVKFLRVGDFGVKI